MQVGAFMFVALVGSLRQDCPTRAVANTLDELAPDDVEVDVLASVGDLPHFNDAVLSASFPKEVTAMRKSIAAADGLVIVTPEYNRSVPGTLKNALDWLGQSPGGALTGKPVAIQTASFGMSGGIRAQDHLRQMLLALDATVLNKPEIAIPHVMRKIDREACVLRDDKTRGDISLQLEALARLSRAAKLLANATPRA